MSNLNIMIADVFAEAVGYGGVEMYNDKFPTSQNDGNDQSVSSDRSGSMVVSPGGSDESTYMKYDTIPGDKSYGDLALDMVKSKNPGFHQEYNQANLNQSRNGDSVLQSFSNSK